MQGPNSISGSQGSSLNADQAALSGSQDLAALLKNDKNQKNKKDGKTELDPNKPTSLSLLDGDTDSKGIFERFADKLAHNQLLQSQGKLGNLSQEQLVQAFENYLKEEGQDKSEDHVLISNIVRQYKASTEKTKSKDTEDFSQSEIGVIQDLFDDQANTIRQKDASNLAQQKSRSEAAPLQKDTTVIKDTLAKYIAGYAENLVKPTPSKKQEIDRMRQTLIDQGLPMKAIKKVEASAERIVREDVRKQIKKSFTELALTFDSKNLSADSLQKNQLFNKLQKLGEETGAIKSDSDIEDIKQDAKSDLNTMVTQELDNAMIKTRVEERPISDILQEFDKYSYLAKVSKFDSGAYAKEFQKKMDNLGLNHFLGAPNRGTLDTQSGNSQQRQKNQEEAIQEMESISDNIRTLFMKQAMKLDLKNQLKIRYDLFKLKRASGLSKEQLDQLRKEGEGFAQQKLIALLKEAFEERATTADFTSTAYKLVKAKFKRALSGLKNLGVKPTKEELTTMRDQINKSMFTVIKEDYLKIESYLESNPPNKTALEAQRKDYLKILTRLKKESNILEEISSKATFSDTQLDEQKTNIIEAA
jgi:nucleoside diphosphate kinase